MKKILTDLFIKSVQADTVRLEVYDQKVPGLTLRITPKGKKSFSFTYRMPGNKNKQRLQIGVYPSISLGVARDKAIAAMSDIRNGVDPSHCIQDLKRTPLIKDLIHEFWERELTNKKAAKDMLRLINKDVLPEWGNLKASSITRRDVVMLLDKVRDRGAPVTANRLHGRLTRMFNFASERGIIEASPMTRLRKTEEKPRERVLNDEEIQKFWLNIDKVGIHPLTSIALRLILSTAQRPGEVINMCWHEVDLDTALWRIPADKSKNGRAHKVPLNSTSLNLLDQAKIYSKQKEYVFPSPVKTTPIKPIEVRTLSRSIHRKHSTIGIDKFVPHDLRRTARTKFAQLKINDVIAERILNHSLHGITKVYNHHDYLEEMQEALTIWEKYIMRIISMPINLPITYLPKNSDQLTSDVVLY